MTSSHNENPMFAGAPLVFAILICCGGVLASAAILAYETPPLPATTSCGSSCPILPAPPLTWSGAEFAYLGAGVGAIASGSTGLSLTTLARRRTDPVNQSLDSGRSLDLLRGAQAALISGTGFVGFLAAAGTTSLTPNGAGSTLLSGGAMFLGVGAVLLWRAVVSGRGRKLPEMAPGHAGG